MPNINAEEFQRSHVSILLAIEDAGSQLANLQPPYRQSIVYALRRGLYKIEKSSKSLSLTLLPLLAFELEAFAAELAKAEVTIADDSAVGARLQKGLELIRQGLQALARGEQEASVESARQIGQLVNQLRQQRDSENADLDLTPSAATVLRGDDELENFEKSLQAMQQELQGVLASKPSSKEA